MRKEELQKIIHSFIKEKGTPTLIVAPVKWKFAIMEMVPTVKCTKVFLPSPDVLREVLYIENTSLIRLIAPLTDAEVA